MCIVQTVFAPRSDVGFDKEQTIDEKVDAFVKQAMDFSEHPKAVRSKLCELMNGIGFSPYYERERGYIKGGGAEDIMKGR
jgi:hypothetical protein